MKTKKKKKGPQQKYNTFFPKFTLIYTPIQIIGGDTAKLLGGYIPTSPLVSAPLSINIIKFRKQNSPAISVVLRLLRFCKQNY